MTDGFLIWILENTLIVAALCGGVLLIKKLFHRHLSAMMHYVLWGIVILKLLMPVSIASEASPWNLFSVPAPAQNTVAEAEAEPNASAAENTVQADYRPAAPANAPFVPGGASAPGTGIVISPPFTQPQPAPIAPIDVNWPVLAAVVWLAGTCATSAWLLMGKIRVQRQIEQTYSGPAPAWMNNMLDGCRAVLRINRNIGIVLQEALPVPAIMGVWNPKLILPARLAEEGDKNQLRHIFFHELMHYKRRDLAVIAILNVLSALYWFNPVVWLLIKFLRKDMETACDSNVLTALGSHRRQDYIFTLVKFTGRSNHCRMQAALSLNDGKSNMKKRIAGMFLNSRTELKIKLPVVLLILVMAFTCFTTACQPTPEKPVVAGKGDLEEMITEAPSASQTAAAVKTITKSMSRDKLSVEFNAKVEVPSADKFPVVKVLPQSFTQEQADRIIKTLMQGKPIYEPPTEKTRAEIEEEIVYYKALQDKFSDDEKARSEAGVAGNESAKMGELIAQLEQELAKAPEKVVLKPASGRFAEQQYDSENDGKLDYKSQYIEVAASLGQDYYARLFINCSKSKKMVSVWYTHQKEQEIYTIWNTLPDGKAAGMSMSREEALALAKKTAADMGCELKLASVRLAPKMEKMREVSANQAYAFFFTREINGVPTTYDYGDGSMLEYPEDEKDLKYFEPYPFEQLYMIIDDTGIVELQWVSPMKLGETVSENAKILNVDEAMERFEQQFFIENAAKSAGENETVAFKADLEAVGRTNDIKQYHYTIDRITLGLMRLPVKDKPGEYMLVPVWDFFGKVKKLYNTPVTDRNGNEVTEETVDRSVWSIMTINAIDGSVIKRSKDVV